MWEGGCALATVMKGRARDQIISRAGGTRKEI